MKYINCHNCCLNLIYIIPALRMLHATGLNISMHRMKNIYTQYNP